MIDYLWIGMIIIADLFWLIYSISSFQEGVQEKWIRKDTIMKMLDEIPLFWWLLVHSVILFCFSLIRFLIHTRG